MDRERHIQIDSDTHASLIVKATSLTWRPIFSFLLPTKLPAGVSNEAVRLIRDQLFPILATLGMLLSFISPLAIMVKILVKKKMQASRGTNASLEKAFMERLVSILCKLEQSSLLIRVHKLEQAQGCSFLG